MNKIIEYSQTDLENLFKAGDVLSKIFKKILPQIKPGMKIADIVDSIELLTLKYDTLPSFPPNLSINSIAAHDTAMIADERIIPPDSLVKIDFGVQIDGCLTDCARTLAFGDVPSLLVDASKEALETAIKMAKPGVHIGDIGSAVQDTIEKYGFKPISNLFGHQVIKGLLHAPVGIPSVKSYGSLGNRKLEKNCTYAIEPFATNGNSGMIDDLPDSYPLIFSMDSQPRGSFAKKLYEKYKYIPFSARMASRMLKDGDSFSRFEKILRTAHKENWNTYFPLLELSNGLVAQSEDMILVDNDGAQIVTLGAYN